MSDGITDADREKAREAADWEAAIRIGIKVSEYAETVADYVIAGIEYGRSGPAWTAAVPERPISNEGRPMNRRKGRMVQASELIAEIQDIMAKWGDTCFYVTGLAWGSVALWQQSDYDASVPASPTPAPRERP